MNDHVTKMAAATTDDGPNTVRIRVVVPDIKFQVRYCSGCVDGIGNCNALSSWTRLLYTLDML